MTTPQTLADHGVLASIGTVDDALDNAVAESFVDSFKTKQKPTAPGRHAASSSWPLWSIAWFNNEQLHQALEHQPPREIKELHAAKQGKIPIKSR